MIVVRILTEIVYLISLLYLYFEKMSYLNLCPLEGKHHGSPV